jgi:CTP:molybdopterin cytidylyltransferase MocA
MLDCDWSSDVCSSDLVGAPAVFREPFLAALGAIDDERGAKAVLLANLARVTRVPMPEAGLDVDTPQSLPGEQATPRR